MKKILTGIVIALGVIKTVIICAIVVQIVLAAALIGFMIYDFENTEPEIMQVEESPDGRYVAYVFEKNAGATTRFTYRLSVLKQGQKLSNSDDGNAYISYGKFDVEWIGDDTLLVHNYESDIFEQKSRVSDVNVFYDYIEP